MSGGETVFVTGATGFIGGYAVKSLLDAHADARVLALTRTADPAGFRTKMWRTLQMHVRGDVAAFDRLMTRIAPVGGDLHAPGLGISPADMARLVAETDSVLHIAASLNRKSAKACLNSNLRGTLSVIKVARAIHDAPASKRTSARKTKKGEHLRRFSHVSTVAVAGERNGEVVTEDTAIEWDRSDYDPYGRTKKFCEHMVRELLPDVPRSFFRPSIVLGDSRWPETTQFDMLRAFAFFVDAPLVPLRGEIRVDTVNADWVGDAIATIHMESAPQHEIYHLSSGTDSLTARQIADSVADSLGKKTVFAGALESPFAGVMNALAAIPKRNVVTQVAWLMKVFMPYITFDTVFDNSRAVAEMGGRAPVPISDYYAALHRFAKANQFRYPYTELPAATTDGAGVDTSRGGKAA